MADGGYAERRRQVKVALLEELQVRADTAEEAEHLWETAEKLGMDEEAAGRMIESVGREVAGELQRRLRRLSTGW